MKDLHGKNVLVLGLGASGLAMARWCARSGAVVTVADTRMVPPQLETLKREFPVAEFVGGEFAGTLFDGKPVDILLKSPGIPPDTIKPLLANNAGGSYTTRSELDLFSRALTDLKESVGYSPAVLAITGTNGKTTVTALTGQLIARAGKSVAIAGNIGPTLLDTLTLAIDNKALPQVWVIELSSFQLDGVEDFEATAATVLNISQDHLDWHGSMEAYTRAKARVFGRYAKMILNREDCAVMEMAPQLQPSGRVKGGSRPLFETFGTNMPTRAGDFGVEVVDGVSWLVRMTLSDGARRKRTEEAEEIFTQRLLPTDSLQIHGKHNASNALAALSLALAAGCSIAPLLYGLREYRGEPHRVELIRVVGGVEFIDDSKGTNVGATVAAINGLGGNRKLVVILGGEGKGQDFSPLAVPVASHVRAVILIGRDGHLIADVLRETGVQLLEASSMKDAVTVAALQAVNGDAVLLSPACASFDMFDNYEHRAASFRKAVASLSESLQALIKESA